MPRISHMVLPVSDVNQSKDWYVNKLGFTLERERDGVAGIKDKSGLIIFLQKSSSALTGPKINFTIQVDNVDYKYVELAGSGVRFVSGPKRHFWGYGAEVLDPDGYMNHLWDEVSMRKAMNDAGGRQ